MTAPLIPLELDIAADRWQIRSGLDVLLQAEVRCLPDRTLDISGVESGSVHPELRGDRAAGVLLQKAIALAERRQLRYLRHVAWEGPPGLPESALRVAGFSPATGIEQWTSMVPVSPEPSLQDPSIRHMSLRDTTTNGQPSESEDVLRLLSLLRACLETSEDLSSLPRVDPDHLLMTWRSLGVNVDIVVAAPGGMDVGLAVISGHTTGGPATLEYLAVVPRRRRHGYATQLIAEAARLVNRSHHQDTSGQALRTLVAWCDEQNRAASAFYRKNAFVRTATASLWVRPMAPTD